MKELKLLHLHKMLDDQDLIAGCLKGDRTSQRELYEKFSGKMMVVCLRYSRDELEAKEIMFDGFLKVYNNLEKFRKECPLEAWIYRVMVNTALKHYRKRNRIYPVIDIEQAHNVQNYEEDILSKFGYKDLLEIVHSIPQRYSVVFNLYVIEGYSHKEIAEELGIPEGTSKSNLSRARAMIQEILRKREEVNRGRSI